MFAVLLTAVAIRTFLDAGHGPRALPAAHSRDATHHPSALAERMEGLAALGERGAEASGGPPAHRHGP